MFGFRPERSDFTCLRQRAGSPSDIIRTERKHVFVTRISTFGALMARRQRGQDNEDILAALQGLSAADLEAAVAYYQENTQEIDHAIRRNSED